MYGVTTGFGKFAGVFIPKEKAVYVLTHTHTLTHTHKHYTHTLKHTHTHYTVAAVDGAKITTAVFHSPTTLFS